MGLNTIREAQVASGRAAGQNETPCPPQQRNLVSPPNRPNIVLITTHDTGRHFGCYGVPTVRTPRIDGLAAEGVRFTNHFTTTPVCSASRATMLTGRYPQSHGLLHLIHPPCDWRLNPGERHLSHVLRGAGYHTSLHCFQHEAPLEDLGFDEWHTRWYDDKPYPDNMPTADQAADGFAAFLAARRDRERPFYAQIGFNETHVPFRFGGVEPDGTHGVYIPPYLVDNEASRAHFAPLQGAIHVVDRAVGTILDALSAAGLAQDTITIFTTDHGIEAPRSKWFLYDPGIETAFLLRWPGGGIEAGQTCDQLTCHIDVFPTILELAGLPALGNVQGRSLAGALADANAPTVHDEVFGYYQPKELRSVRTRTHKLIRNFHEARELVVPVDMTRPGTHGGRLPFAQLFDLQSDPNEFENLADRPDYAEVLEDLDGRLSRWMESVDDPILHGPTPTPYYEDAIEHYRRSRPARSATQR